MKSFERTQRGRTSIGSGFSPRPIPIRRCGLSTASWSCATLGRCSGRRQPQNCSQPPESISGKDATRKASPRHAEAFQFSPSRLAGTSSGRLPIAWPNSPMPTVSVVVPNYNHARFLRQRVDSILAQTFQDFELILLDDWSTDESRSILREYVSDPRVRTEFNEVNSGSTFKQWNKGVRLARGKYVWLAESDDSAATRFLQSLVPLLVAD